MGEKEKVKREVDDDREEKGRCGCQKGIGEESKGGKEKKEIERENDGGKEDMEKRGRGNMHV